MAIEPVSSEDFSAFLGVEDERPPCQIYLISPPELDLDTHATALEEALSAGAPIAAYQLRMKHYADEAIMAAAARLPRHAPTAPDRSGRTGARPGLHRRRAPARRPALRRRCA